jgi:hypothetical protein
MPVGDPIKTPVELELTPMHPTSFDPAADVVTPGSLA